MSGALELFFMFFKIGLFTIGGGMAMIPLVQQELVAKGMMSLSESIDMVALSQITPGPFAVNCATFAGMRVVGGGFGTAAITTIGVALSSFFICLIVGKYFFRCNENPIVRGGLSGIKPAVLALIFAGFISIARSSIFPGGVFSSIDVPVLCIALVLSFLMIKTKINPTLLVLASGIFGVIFLR